MADVTPGSRYPTPEARQRFFSELVARVEALPGVERACASNDVPLDNTAFNMTYVAEGSTRLVGSFPKTVTAGCFEVLRLRATRGRLFHEVEPEPVAIVSETMARRLWPDGREPVGRRIHVGLPSGQLLTVVGVVPDIRNASLESAEEQQVWMPHSVGVFGPERLLVRSAVPPATLATQLRAVLRDLDPELALANVRTLEDVVERVTAPRRFMLALLMTFGGIALGLSAVGIYGVLSHLAGRRTREIGIRMALGARATDVIRLIGTHTALAIVLGAAVGAYAAHSGSQLFESMLFRSVSAEDVRVYAGVVAFVVAVALVAAWVPTRRAARLNPVRALRE
jgi:predicted permease